MLSTRPAWEFARRSFCIKISQKHLDNFDIALCWKFPAGMRRIFAVDEEAEPSEETRQ